MEIVRNLKKSVISAPLASLKDREVIFVPSGIKAMKQ